MGATNVEGGQPPQGRRAEPSASELILGAESEQRPVLSVVMPTLNEEAGIEECLTKIKRAVDELEITTEIIVSDSSTDRTPAIAREHGAIVVEPDQPGYGYAYQYAFARARGDYIAIGDADTTYDFEELPKLFEAVAAGDCDMAMGSRFDGEIEDGAMPALHRYIGNPALTAFLNVFYGAGVSDAHSGFRVLSRDALEQLELQSHGMEFASEMIMDASVKNISIEEVPITYHERVGDATLNSFQDGWRHIKFMLINAPGYLFTIPAFSVMLTGIAFLAISQFGWTFGGIFFGVNTAVIGSFLVLLGYEIGFLAVFSTNIGTPIRPQTDPIIDWVQRKVRLEHGATVGLFILISSTILFLLMAAQWISSGYTDRPLVVHTLPVLTGMVLGIQTMFNSFFLDIVRQESST